MFSFEDKSILKPMNCPGHVQIFKQHRVSYKSLPIRLSEFGCCHRNEPSGAIQGLLRLKQFVQDDGHIFCSRDQIESEVQNFCKLVLEIYKDFGFFDIEISISLRPDSYAGEKEIWDEAESILQECVEKLNIPFSIKPKEGAFYGPKIEFGLRDSIGRLWQCGTLQLDFVLPKKLDAWYQSPKEMEHPVMIHRAALGSIERFIGILLEHHKGIPFWLEPDQVVILPVEQKHKPYAQMIQDNISLRSKISYSDMQLSRRIKDQILDFIPLIFVIGDKEEQEGSISIRKADGKVESVSLENIKIWLKNEGYFNHSLL